MLKKNQLEELTDILEVIESLTFVETSWLTNLFCSLTRLKR